MSKWLLKLDKFLDRCTPWLLILLVVVLLRVPNFFEPYWYGDEGIYLTIGNALRHGEKMYAQIVDHKTPLIYYLAMTPHQVWFRVLNLAFALVSVIGFGLLAKKILMRVEKKDQEKSLKIKFYDKREFWAWVATLIFGVVTSLPALEGNIPNGELFMMAFMIWGGVILFYLKKWWWPAVAGLVFSLGVLTKVPAVFDGIAISSWLWWGLLKDLKWKQLLKPKNRQLVGGFLGKALLIGAGLGGGIALSVLYFVLRGSGQAYLDFGLLYNFRYVQNWALPFSDPWLVELFTLPSKMGLLLAGVLLMTLLSKWMRKEAQWILTWVGFALVAATLSNRPYPHYYLQVIPPLVLLVTYLAREVVAFFRTETKFWEVVLSGAMLWLVFQVFSLLNVGFYPTWSYYTRFEKLISGQMTREEYNQSFNHLMKDNYQAAKLIRLDDNPYLLIWGTNPMLYAQTGKVPVGRFTVSFHIRDFNAYQETLDDFKAKKPKFVVVMKDEEILPGLAEELNQNYRLNGNFEYFRLWMARE